LAAGEYTAKIKWHFQIDSVSSRAQISTLWNRIKWPLSGWYLG
jgi:hypothetical protein